MLRDVHVSDVLLFACSGRHNPEIAADLFPDWPEDKRTAFYEEKEQRFRDMAGEHPATPLTWYCITPLCS